MRGRYLGILLFSVAMVLNGCSNDYPQTYRVQGVVTLEGKPLPNVIVTFIPDGAGQSANGIGDAQGNFKLSTFSPNDGALAGEYKVAIMPKDPPPMTGEAFSSPGGSESSKKKYTPPFPSRYGLPENSGFTASVKENGTNQFTFDLKNK